MIRGINHITFSVKDAEKSFAFYRDILGFKPVAKWPKGSYFLAGGIWIALVLDEHTQKQELPEYSHVAFSLGTEEFEVFRHRFEENNVRIWQENKTEGESIYFCDPDGHKLELHCSDLETRLRTAKADPWPGLEFLA
jgi:catechol 2,3-dioxygenase-like lactoylglutathione lyase family enzyme